MFVCLPGHFDKLTVAQRRGEVRGGGGGEGLGCCLAGEGTASGMEGGLGWGGGWVSQILCCSLWGARRQGWLCWFWNCCLFHVVGSRANKGAARKRPSEADLSHGAVREKKKRKQKPRLPKNFDPENPGPKPDPERWLPKWQRSDFKKKRNRRREKASNMLKRFSLMMLCVET